MGDLSFLPQQSKTVEAIYAWHKKQQDEEGLRNYLGASAIGHECDRYLWYGFRQCVKESFEGRMHRLFETGHLAELRFIRELEGIGCTVKSKDDDGNQFGGSAIGGHFKFHMDAVILGLPEAPKTWHVGEFKTHNNDSFKTLVKVGVKEAKPRHYAQIISEMGLTKLDRAFYLAVNKDTDALYSERIEHNPAEFKSIMIRAERIIRAQQPPERCSSRSDDFRCKFCSAHDLCWGSFSQVAVPLACKSCRTCCHATPEIPEVVQTGPWTCKIKPGAFEGVMDHVLSSKEQERTCPKHLLLPGLVTFADTCDAGDDWIEFQNHKDGAHWRHGTGENGTWSTEELMRTPGPLVGEKAIQQAKTLFGGTVTGIEVPALSLVQRYPPGDSRLLWEGEPSEIENGIMGLLMADVFDKKPTDKQDDDSVKAFEYAGRYLLVIYKNDANYAAIWEGVE